MPPIKTRSRLSQNNNNNNAGGINININIIQNTNIINIPQNNSDIAA